MELGGLAERAKHLAHTETTNQLIVRLLSGTVVVTPIVPVTDPLPDAGPAAEGDLSHDALSILDLPADDPT